MSLRPLDIIRETFWLSVNQLTEDPDSLFNKDRITYLTANSYFKVELEGSRSSDQLPETKNWTTLN